MVADFHSEAEALAARDAFNREVRQGLEPADTETVPLPPEVRTEKGVRLDKLLALVKLADSVTDATRKIKSGAVEVNGEIHRDILLTEVAELLVLRLGKKWKRVKA
jgi:tyrosyl-tRNA synthetase